jgi:integrase
LLRLRIKDIDLERRQVVVRGGKGDQDRVTVLPEAVVERLRSQMDRLRKLHEADLAAGVPGVWLPEALERKWPAAKINASAIVQNNPSKVHAIVRPPAGPGATHGFRGSGAR